MSSMSSREIITELDKKGEAKELSKQALETLSIIAYKAKVTKAEIDFIRGVNSVFILRNLLVRGLITKKNNILDKRSPLYIVTHDLLAHLGIEGIEQLPGHLKISQRLNELEDEFNQEQNHSEIIEVGDSSAH